MQPARSITLAALVGLAGCIETGPTPPVIPPMCEVSADCDQGEMCDEGVCWGDPPAQLTFAAVIVPPTDRPDLAVTEIPALDIAQDGTISNLAFAPSVTVTGRVSLACPVSGTQEGCGIDTSIAAQITVTRAATIPGGPAFSRHIVSAAGVGTGDAAFSLVLPKITGDGPGYEITVLPGVEGEDSIASIAPPLRITFGGQDDLEGAVWLVGDPDHFRLAAGRVIDAAGRGLSGMRVFAAADRGGQRVRVSSLSTTSATGAFVLSIPLDFRDPADLVVKPGPEVIAPTLVVSGVTLPVAMPSDTGPAPLGDLTMPSYPAPAAFSLPISGPQSSGEVLPVSGAQVELSTVLSEEGAQTVTFSTMAVTGEDGTATAMLIPASDENRIYHAHIASPPTSELASLFDYEIPVAASAGVLEQITLPVRVATSATVESASGEAVAGATITASAGADLLSGLVGDDLARVQSTRFPQTTTDDGGNFVLWLDPALAGHDAIYDFEIVPPAGAGAPRWSTQCVHIDGDSPLGSLSLGEMILPPAAYARGEVTASGEAIPGAEVRLYEVAADSGAAHLRGLWQSRDDGTVWIVLPDP